METIEGPTDLGNNTVRYVIHEPAPTQTPHATTIPLVEGDAITVFASGCIHAGYSGLEKAALGPAAAHGLFNDYGTWKQFAQSQPIASWDARNNEQAQRHVGDATVRHRPAQ